MNILERIVPVIGTATPVTLPFNFEGLAKGVVSQSVWLLVIIAVGLVIGGIFTQGIGGVLVKIGGILLIIFFLLAVMKGEAIGQWLLDAIWKEEATAGTGAILPPIFRGGALQWNTATLESSLKSISFTR